MVAERGRGRITFRVPVILGHAAVAGSAAMEALTERVRPMEGEVTRRREVLAENENLRRRLHAAEQRLAMGERRAGDRDGGTAAAAAPGPSSGQVVGARLLNKPRTFTGLHSEWKIWSLDFEAYVFAHSRLGDLLKQASRTAGVLAAQTELGATLNTQLYYILVSVTSDVAKVEVRKAPRGDGLAAWWRLLREFAPRGANRFAAMLGRIIIYEFADPVMTNLAEFEQLVRECADQSGEVSSDNMKQGAIMSGIKNEKLAEPLSLNASLLVTCDDLKMELKTISSSQRRWAAADSGGDGVVPTQVDATGEGKGKNGKGKGKDGKGKKGDSKGKKGDSKRKKGDSKGKDRETRSCHYCGKAGHLAADCRKKKADEKKGRKVALLTDATQVRPSASTATTALKGGSTDSQSSLAPAIDVSHVAAVLAHMQLQQQRSPPSTSATVHIANIQVAGDADIPTLAEYYWQVDVMCATTQCDALPVAVGDSVEFDWALFDTGSGLTTCPQEFANMTEMLPPKKLPLCESATGDEVTSMGARILAAESDGVPLQIEFQVTKVRCAIVSADAFTDGGHVPILGEDPYILLADGREIKLYRLSQTRKEINVRAIDDSEKTERYCGFLEKPRRLRRQADPGRLIPLVCVDYLFLGDVEGDPLAAVLNILEYQSGAIGCAQMAVKGPADYAVAVTTAAMRMWGLDRAICESGETVMYQIQNVAHRKAEIRWGKAVWAGKDNRTGEHLLATAAGRKTARTINGRVEDQRWSRSLFNKVECMPWDARAGPGAAPPPPRRRCIARAIIDRVGPAPGCDGSYGLGHPRTESCRDRIESLLKEEDISLLSLRPPTSNLHQQHRLQRRLLSCMAQRQIKAGDLAAQEQQDGMVLGTIKMDWNGTVATEKPRRKQKVIAGLFVHVATAVLALTCGAIPYDSETDANKHSLYDRESPCQNVFGARSGRRLGPSLVKQGRDKEHRQMEEFQVFDRVPQNFANGKRVRWKWVDDGRYDDDGRESVRSRFVAMQFAWDVRDDIFAGMPLLAAFRLVVSFASSLYSMGIGCDGMLALYDVSVAPPKGEEPEGIVYQLRRALCGTRRTSFLFQNLIMGVMEKGGFVRIKHVEILVSTMLSRKTGESNTTKRTITPSSKTTGKDCRESSDELSTEYAAIYRSMAPTALYQAVGYLMRGMVAPTWHHWLLLEGVAVEQHPQFELVFDLQRMPKVIVAEVDSDWASEPGRSSMDGGFLFIGSHLIDGWSGQQGRRALSSAEAEFTGMVNGSAGGIWLRSVMLEMGFEVTLQVNAGSSGAKGVASRLGCGKVRHLETKYLWVQEKVRDRTITMAKIHVDVNRADMQTKPLEGPRFLKLLASLPHRTPSSGRMQVFGVMLAAAMLGGVQGSAVFPCNQAVMVVGSSTVAERTWTTMLTVMFGSTLAIAFLATWIVCRIYKAPLRFLKGLWGLVKADEGENVLVARPPVEEEHEQPTDGLEIEDCWRPSRHTQTAPVPRYWAWSAVDLRAECERLRIFHGQLKAQMIVDLLIGAGRK
ncbi:unnamed protein product [Prorocentrum cordatum]|uniref:CCHC-type domain-containing protein n=1 Tax=Prorocentrum cordatum TaxID=2364126 RepID=A0ABN9TQP4_9DINO|nr:unnamed protein product [Polarella glacialis]